MSDVKLCKDCRHCSYWHNDMRPSCMKAGPPDLVQGGRLPVYCDETREAGAPCGPDAALWEARPVRPVVTPSDHSPPVGSFVVVDESLWPRPSRRWWQFWRRK